METRKIESLSELKSTLSPKGRSYVLLYKSDSEKSLCALDNLSKANSDEQNLTVFTADVSKVIDIHPEYGIKSLPSLLEFEKGE